MKSLARSKIIKVYSIIPTQQTTSSLFYNKLMLTHHLNNKSLKKYSITSNILDKENILVEPTTITTTLVNSLLNNTNNNNNNNNNNTTNTTNNNVSSSLLIDNNNPSSKCINNLYTISTDEYKFWTKEQVCSILCTEKKNGGADLSIKDIKPLYDNTNFDGSFLVDIVSNIQEKNKEYAIKQLVAKCLKADIRINIELKDTIEQIVDWIDKLNKISNAQITPDNLKSARNDPLYDYLRNRNDPLKMNKLEAMIGSNIQLPIFGGIGSEYVPKDFNPTIPYLLTRQAFEILKKVITRSEEGFVFSGPFGISKSYIMYLIACYAIVNSMPLLYIPKCAIWVDYYYSVEGGKIGADNYLRSMIFHWNSDILSQDQILQLYDTSKDIVSTFSTIFSKDKIIYYLFDEHRQLFWKYSNGMPIKETYFTSYSHWNGATSSSQCSTMTIYCGDAHSEFEYNLPGGTEHKIIRIIPPTSLEFQKLVENFGFKLDSNRIKKMEYATGRIPRELSYFAHFYPQDNNSKDEQDDDCKLTDRQFGSFIKIMMHEYEERIQNLVRKSNSTEIQSFLKTIHHLFNLSFIDENARLTADPSGPVYDLGLLYKTQDNYLYPINEAAKRALFEFYVSNVVMNTSTTTLSSSECDFKRLILLLEYKPDIFYWNNHRYHLTSRNSKTNSIKLSSEIISYNINSMSSIDIRELNKMKELSRNNRLNGECILFIPETKQFPSIDYFIVSYISDEKIQIVFKKATLSTIAQHYNDGEFEKLFTPKYLVNENIINLINSSCIIKENGIRVTNDYTYSLFELIIHSIIDNYNNTTNSIQIKSEQVNLRKKQFKYKNNVKKLNRKIIVNGIEISWYFVYESFVSESNQNFNIKHSNINFRNREDLEINPFEFKSVSTLLSTIFRIRN